MNISVNSFQSQSSLFDFGALKSQTSLFGLTGPLPSFDKINTFWKSQKSSSSASSAPSSSNILCITNKNDKKKTIADDQDEEYNPNFNMSKSKKEKRALRKDYKPSPYSVICGRTQNCYNSTGNRRFRVTCKMFLDEYAQADGKSEKSAVVSRVLEIIQKASPEGAFITYENGRWYEVSDRVKREKIGGLFRDLLSHKYKSSAKAKQAKKVARAKILEEEQIHHRNQFMLENEPLQFQQPNHHHHHQYVMEQQVNTTNGESWQYMMGNTPTAAPIHPSVGYTNNSAFSSCGPAMVHHHQPSPNAERNGFLDAAAYYSRRKDATADNHTRMERLRSLFHRQVSAATAVTNLSCV